ncbi:hypothetical protein BS50DRAFT_475245, partial [Corynespora cassiicola Philippines]
KCPPFSGNFTVKKYQLYPENADFDNNTCKLFIGQLWNASLGIYDPYTQAHETIDFPNISHDPAFHMGGVGADASTGLISIVADAGAAFGTNGKDISGTNWLLRLDAATKKVVWQVNLTETSRGVYGGFQDVEHDPDGNVFVVGTWPGSLLKVSADGNYVVPWYLPAQIVQTQKGIGGIAALGWTLIAQGDQSGALWRFDMRAAVGVPVPIPITKGNHTFESGDAIQLPPKYGGEVLLVAENNVGVSVFRSPDQWLSAEFKGMVPIGSVEPGTSAVAPVQVGDAVYMVLEPFGDVGLGGPGTAGNRSEFLFRDITGEVDALLR